VSVRLPSGLYLSPLQWSIWLSVFWGSWWAASALFALLPRFLRATIAAIIGDSAKANAQRPVSLAEADSLCVSLVTGGDRSWTDLAKPLRKWFTLFAWSLVSWLTFLSLVAKRADDGNSESNATNLTLITNLFFGLFLCSCVIAGEKVSGFASSSAVRDPY
jgi:hypothetical protein